MSTTQSASTWAGRFARPATALAEVEEVEETLVAVETPPPSKKPTRQIRAAEEPAIKVRPPAKRAVTYRLTDDDLELVDLALAALQAEAMRLKSRGKTPPARPSRDEVIAMALRQTYANLREE
jgi:hypothetical protein